MNYSSSQVSNGAKAVQPLMSARDVATFYEVSDRTVYGWDRDGLLPEPAYYEQSTWIYRATDIWTQWQQLNPGVEHPGCALLSRHVIGTLHRVHPKIIGRIADAGYLPLIARPTGELRIPETALPRFRDRLAELYRRDQLDLFAEQISTRLDTAYYLLVRFGAAEVLRGPR